MTLTRAAIRAKLMQPRRPRAVGDVHTAFELMSEDQLHTYDAAIYGALPSTGIPYDQAPGAPGIRAKRTPAAVLVALIERSRDFSVLLTTRTSDLKHHAGQIAFPGGRREPEDTDMIACALREAEEEVGLARHAVEVLGVLSPYVTITGFEVTPVIGVVAPPISFTPDTTEVADIFEVPLSFLLDPANHRREQRDVKGQKRAYYALVYEGRYIWGATAGMILNLADALSPDHQMLETAS
jgi:8-oxo-dGTP pyrophosphatase MutT (NUDIX family)